MDIHDRAYALAKALKESADYKEMQQLFSELNKEPDTKKVLDDFRGQQFALQQRMMSGSAPSEEEIKQMEKKYERIKANALIDRVFEMERRLGATMEDVNRIITEPLDELFGQ